MSTGTFVDRLCKEDDESVSKTIYSEYWHSMALSGLYLRLDTPKWRMLSLLQLLLMMSFITFLIGCAIVTCIQTAHKPMIMFQYMHYMILTVLIVISIITSIFNRPKIARMHRAIANGLSHYDENTEQHRKKMLKRKSKYKKILFVLLAFYFINVPIYLAFVAPVLDEYSSSANRTETYRDTDLAINLPVPFWLPFSTDSLLMPTIGYGMELILACIIVGQVAAADFVLLTAGITITMELELLIISLSRLPKRALAMHEERHGPERSRQMDVKRIREDKDLAKCYADCLKQNVQHHQRIIQMFDDYYNFFFILLFVVIMTGTIFIAISGSLIMFVSIFTSPPLVLVLTRAYDYYIILLPNRGSIALYQSISEYFLFQAEGGLALRVMSVGFCFAEISNIFFNCWCAEQIFNASEQLLLALYSTNWRMLTKDSARTVLIMMTRATQPLTFNCLGLVVINFETFSNVMNSAYSYFNLLNAFGGQD
ncbi:uncharacterized protein isoform X1 [Rhodnius prolixus]|uniref:uncharacterized protein isoform X1 n=1 Tax=Rhodnius prolixus TaxID=13249 RepID=UPI003D18DED3